MTEVELDTLVLAITNYGASTVLLAIRDISIGFCETQQAIIGVTSTSDTMFRMWNEIATAITPVVSKTERIEAKYKSLAESRRMILDAIKRASEKEE